MTVVGSGTVASGVTLYTVPGSSSASSATASVVAAALPPRLLLAVTDVLGRLVHVKRGTPYLRCAADQVPTPELPCEPLGLASDDLDGDLTDWVSGLGGGGAGGGSGAARSGVGGSWRRRGHGWKRSC